MKKYTRLVLKSTMTCFLIIFLFTLTKGQGIEKVKGEKNFEGLFGAIELGSQNIFSGAFIDGVDVLDHENRFVAELSSGYRHQMINDRLLIGAELRFGLVDGSLHQLYEHPSQALNIQYQNHTQAGIGITLGSVLGKSKRVLIYIYTHRMNRKFDILFTEENGIEHDQRDEMRFLRYGIGLEVKLKKQFNIRANTGRVYVDFDDMETTEDVMDKTDFSIGLVYQL